MPSTQINRNEIAPLQDHPFGFFRLMRGNINPLSDLLMVSFLNERKLKCLRVPKEQSVGTCVCMCESICSVYMCACVGVCEDVCTHVCKCMRAWCANVGV